jgi:AraC family transcriptional regulator
MLSLQQGSYLGCVDKSVHDNYLIASLTSYSEVASQKEKHCHENPHVSFVLSGGSLEKRYNAEIERLPGKISFYHSNEYHQSVKIVDKSKHINLELQRDFFADYEVSENELAHAISEMPDAKFLLLNICKELVYGDELSALSVRLLLLQLIDHSPEKSHAPWLLQIKELLRYHCSETPSLSSLSTVVNVHPVTISREFHRHFACTLGEYMRKLKVEKALEMVKTSNRPLTDIAFECGFADQSHFIRTFKRFTGFLPRNYRKL